jgi:virulence-associated protein VagC
MQCPFALLLALDTSRLAGLWRQCGGLASVRLPVGLFLHAEYDLLRRQGTAVQIAPVPHRLGECSVTGGFGRQPQRMMPRFEPVMQPQAPDTNSAQSHGGRLRPRRSGRSQAIWTRCRATPGENFGVRPGRGFSSSPGTPCARKRWPPWWTCRGDRPTRCAVPVLLSPLANRRMVRALRTTPAGTVDLRCSANNVPRTAAVSTIFQELGLPRRRGGKAGGGKQASLVWLCCSSPTETISECIVSDTFPSCLTRSVLLDPLPAAAQ